MKLSEMRELTAEELVSGIEDLHKALFEARFQKGTNQLSDTSVLGRHRREIAQLKTVLRQKELQSPGENAHA